MGDVLLVTGTGTGVGKTVVTAALAAAAAVQGRSVAVLKPAQTGVGPHDPGDIDVVRRLSQIDDVHELVRYSQPLAPEAAARVSGLPALDLVAACSFVHRLADDHDLVIVEGAGGLLVRFDPSGRGIADLAADLGAPLVLVAHPSLGTLNHTALTLEAVRARGLAVAGLVLGWWPAAPDLACRTNLDDLATLLGRPVDGAIAEGAGALGPEAFESAAVAGLAPSLGGTFDAADFQRRWRAPYPAAPTT